MIFKLYSIDRFTKQWKDESLHICMCTKSKLFNEDLRGSIYFTLRDKKIVNCPIQNFSIVNDSFDLYHFRFSILLSSGKWQTVGKLIQLVPYNYIAPQKLKLDDYLVLGQSNIIGNARIAAHRAIDDARQRINQVVAQQEQNPLRAPPLRQRQLREWEEMVRNQIVPAPAVNDFNNEDFLPDDGDVPF